MAKWDLFGVSTFPFSQLMQMDVHCGIWQIIGKVIIGNRMQPQ